MPAPYRVGILVVSDTASKDSSADRSGPVLRELFTLDAETWSPLDDKVEIVSDDISSIQATLLHWSSRRGVNLAITTGGTGFSTRDVTPEAVRPLLWKEATGLQHLMMSASLSKTGMAALARPVAGVTSDGMVIVTVPGSPKGARENVEAILPVLPHALDLASGGSGKGVHASMGMPARSTAEADSVNDTSNASHSHHQHHHRHHHHSHSHGHGSHHHHHHGPTPRSVRSMDISKGASGRQRQSPYPIISLAEAYDAIFDNTPVLDVVTRPVDEELLGYIVAEDVISPGDLPSTMTTNVDGYAVRAADTPEGVYPVLTHTNYPSIAGGYSSATILNTPLPDKHIYRINTGAPLPLGSDAVIMVEDTELVRTAPDDEKEEREVRLLAAVPRGENVRQPGSDVKKGDTVLEKGTRVSQVGGEIGTLAFVGRTEVSVVRKPRVAIMSTGNEITGLHAFPSDEDKQIGSGAQLPVIYDSNRPSLHTCLAGHGFEVHDLGIVADDEEATCAALRLGCERADVIITTGGTSMGEADLLKPVIERRLNGTVHFGRVAMKPGKPTTFASIPPATDGPDRVPSNVNQPRKNANSPRNPTLVFALPGNPASALVTFHLFVLPCLRKMSGFPNRSSWHLPSLKVQIDTAMRLDPRPEFHRVRIEPLGEAPYLIARSTGGQRSSRTVSLAGANGLICLPSSRDVKNEREHELPKGSLADAILIGSL